MAATHNGPVGGFDSPSAEEQERRPLAAARATPRRRGRLTVGSDDTLALGAQQSADHQCSGAGIAPAAIRSASGLRSGAVRFAVTVAAAGGVSLAEVDALDRTSTPLAAALAAAASTAAGS
jgi:hypothetical protein